MAKTIKYRVLEVISKTSLSDEPITYYIIQRKKFLFWINRRSYHLEFEMTMKFESIEKAIEEIKYWHKKDYGESYVKTKVIKEIEFQVSNWK